MHKPDRQDRNTWAQEENEKYWQTAVQITYSALLLTRYMVIFPPPQNMFILKSSCGIKLKVEDHCRSGAVSVSGPKRSNPKRKLWWLTVSSAPIPPHAHMPSMQGCHRRVTMNTSIVKGEDWQAHNEYWILGILISLVNRYFETFPS